MERFKMWLYRMMQGRYGADLLGTVLSYVGMGFAILALFFRDFGWVLSTIAWLLLIYALWRMMSKNIWKRYAENQKFVQWIQPLKRRWQLFQKQRKDKEHRYFICPKCKQIVRVPKGRGKIEITCPKCKSRFDRKS
ncbi:MAG: hypothetical protein PUF50_08865 [Erysipelotrichaceae bacterium]|nr:hypothetical protein [Erysipelotrichaceae bacterium]